MSGFVSLTQPRPFVTPPKASTKKAEAAFQLVHLCGMSFELDSLFVVFDPVPSSEVLQLLATHRPSTRSATSLVAA